MVGRIFEILNEYYGCQNWWPAENEFEIVVGSVLTQNTNWQNVEKSLNALKGSGVMSPEKILALSDVKLQQLIYSSGFYRIKTRRLKAVCNLLVDRFDGQVLNMKSTDLLRSRELLLDTNGMMVALKLRNLYPSPDLLPVNGCTRAFSLISSMKDGV